MSREIINDIERHRASKRTEETDLEYSSKMLNVLKKKSSRVVNTLFDYATKNKMNEWFIGLYDVIQFEYKKRAGRSVR